MPLSDISDTCQIVTIPFGLKTHLSIKKYPMVSLG